MRIRAACRSRVRLLSSVAVPPPAGTPAVITNTSFDNVSGEWIVETDTPGTGTYQWARVALGAAAPTPDGLGGWTGNTLETGAVAVGASGGALEINENGDTGTQYDLHLHQFTADGASNVIQITYTADNSVPVISAVSVTPGNGQITLKFDTSKAGGLWFGVVTTSATKPTEEEVMSGLNELGLPAAGAVIEGVPASGEQDHTFTGLTNGTPYFVHFLREDSRRNVSAIETSVEVTPAQPTATLGEIGTATEILNVASITSPQTTSAYTVPAGSNRAFFIAVSLYNGGTAITDIAVTFGGQPMTLLGSLYKSFGGSVALFYLEEADIPSGAQAAEITVTGGAPNSAIASTMTFEGVNQATLFGAPVTGTGGNSQVSGAATVTPSNASSLIISALAARKDADAFLPVTADTMTLKANGQAFDGAGSDGVGHATGLRVSGTTDPVAQTFSWANGGSWAMVAAEILEN